MTKISRRFRHVILSGIFMVMIVQAAALEGGVNGCGPGGWQDLWPRVAARLMEAKSLTVYAIDPDPVADDRVLAMQGKDVFQQYAVRGSVEVKASSEIRRIIGRLTADLNLKGCLAMCFLPRHAVRVILPDGKRIDLTICYQCKQIWIAGVEGHGEIAITGESEKVLTPLLRRAGIQLAPSALPSQPGEP